MDDRSPLRGSMDPRGFSLDAVGNILLNTEAGRDADIPNPQQRIGSETK